MDSSMEYISLDHTWLFGINCTNLFIDQTVIRLLAICRTVSINSGQTGSLLPWS